MTALLSVNVLLATNVMIDRVISILEEKIDVTVTFLPGTPDALLNQGRFYLTSLPQTDHVELVTADEALAEFRERNRQNPEVLEALSELSENPLGGQLIIKAKRAEDYPFLLQAIQNPQYAPFIKSSSYDDHQIAITRIEEIGRNVRLAGSALVAIFALFGLITAFNAIRVAIYTHREEIAIMRLVGASSMYIRGPFVLEGVWMGAVSVFLTAAIVLAAVGQIEYRIAFLFDNRSPGLSEFFYAQWPLVFGIQLAVITALSGLVSWIASGRYIRR
jgi:cell division transport system permease protein